MGLFDRIKTTASGVGASIAKGAGQITGKATVEAKESAKIAAVKADIAAVQAEIDTGYVQIGKAYVDACIAGKEVTDIGCGATLKMMEPKLEKKMKLEKELIELEKALADSQIMQERSLVIPRSCRSVLLSRPRSMKSRLNSTRRRPWEP